MSIKMFGIQETLTCRQESGNAQDRYAVAVVRPARTDAKAEADTAMTVMTGCHSVVVESKAAA